MKYEITKEQLKAICIEIDLNQNSAINWLKQWFPKAFEEEKKEMVADKWYWHKETLFNYQSEWKVYGFNEDGSWYNGNSWIWPDKFLYSKEATEQEVFKALKKEAVNRGYVGNYFESVELKDTSYCCNSVFSFNHGILYSNGNSIFCRGKWAEIIQTITREDAEKQLGKKII